MPLLTEHIALMAQLPQGLSRQYRSHIRRFLCYIEQRGSSWPAIVPVSGNTRLDALERAVNSGIQRQSLHTSTRAALNQAFGYNLKRH